MDTPIYLDNLATTRLAPEALKAMLPWLEDRFGNASSSTHQFGWDAAEAIEDARDDICQLIGASHSSEVIFTSGATESNNSVLKGVAARLDGSPRHFIASAIEHPSVLVPCGVLADQGTRITLVSPDSNGLIHPEEVEHAICPETRLISVMAANNEIGSLQPTSEIAKVAHDNGVLLHVDAAQAVGKIDVDVQRFDVDFLSISAHKFNGPKGIGALYIRSNAFPQGLHPLLHGGAQEAGGRAGTVPVAQVVGFGAAAKLTRARWRDDARRLVDLSTRLWSHLSSEIPEISLNGHLDSLLPGCLNFSVSGVLADSLIAATPGVAFSSGSACSSHHGGDSHVLMALGLDQEKRRNSVRIGIGRDTSVADVAVAGDILIRAIKTLRS